MTYAIAIAGCDPAAPQPVAGSTAGAPVAPVELVAAWTAESDQAGALLGYAPSTAGDVNADGFADVAVGAPYADGPATDEGRVVVYLGSAAGLDVSPAWAAGSGRPDANLGSFVAAAGDVDGDGFDDLAVGAPGWDEPAADGGAVFVYLGSDGGLESDPSWSYASDQEGARLGMYRAGSGAGDVDQDGYDDLVVGLPEYDRGTADRGLALLFLGSASGPAVTGWRAYGDASEDLLGYSVSAAGDTNGDGFDDVVIGATQEDGASVDEGAAHLWLGSEEGLEGPVWTTVSGETGARSGEVSRAGDVDGDGFDDVVVGAPYAEGDHGDAGGRAQLFLGASDGLADAPAWTAEGGQTGAHFGVWRSGLAPLDLNGDGHADVAIGAIGYDGSAVDAGEVWVFLGAPDGLSGAWATATSDQADALFGHVASAGDVNGDGADELLVGAHLYDDGETDEGLVYLYLGQRGRR